jgi:type I restriction enzyme S subunit
MPKQWNTMAFREFLTPRLRPYTLGPDEDANLVGMKWYGEGPFHREFKTATKIAKKEHFVIRSGDVIYNKLFAWKGTFGIVPNELDGMFCSDKFPTYELNREKMSEAYLRWYFRYPPLWDQARQKSTGSAAISKLTLNPPKFLDLTIQAPGDVREQERIALRLETLAEKQREICSLKESVREQINVLKQVVLTDLLKGLNRAGRLGSVLILLCYKRSAQQKGQRGSLASSLRAMSSRSVAMEWGLCRWARPAGLPFGRQLG